MVGDGLAEIAQGFFRYSLPDGDAVVSDAEIELPAVVNYPLLCAYYKFAVVPIL